MRLRRSIVVLTFASVALASSVDFIPGDDLRSTMIRASASAAFDRRRVVRLRRLPAPPLGRSRVGVRLSTSTIEDRPRYLTPDSLKLVAERHILARQFYKPLA
jgi:hypothetical protein